MANKDKLIVILINCPIRLGIRKAKYTTNVVAGITTPKPVRRDMLNGRRKFGERFTRIRLKNVAEMIRQMICQIIG